VADLYAGIPAPLRSGHHEAVRRFRSSPTSSPATSRSGENDHGAGPGVRDRPRRAGNGLSPTIILTPRKGRRPGLWSRSNAVQTVFRVTHDSSPTLASAPLEPGPFFAVKVVPGSFRDPSPG